MKCKLPKCEECGQAYMTLAVIAVIIIVYFVLLRLAYPRDKVIHKDIMNVKIFDAPLENCCSAWPISHFILFAVLGFAFPKCGVPVLTLGVGWELFEVALSSVNTIDRQGTRMEGANSSEVEYSQNWWAGSFKDIFMNFAGFGFGWALRKVVDGCKHGTK